MSTLTQLIQRNRHEGVRRFYIKRRLIDGSYEADWQRMDNYRNLTRVTDWGSVSIEIDEQPGLIGSFNVSELSLIVDNQDGAFNVETYSNSFWWDDATYLNRRYSKIKIETAYVDDDGSEVGEADTFEGYIDAVLLAEDYTATLICFSYQAVFQRYPIADLSLTGSKTVTQIIDLITNQSKITDFMPHVAASAGYNFTITDTSTLEGTYWDVLTELAFKSNSILFLSGSTFKFQQRTPGSVVWNFKGSGSDDPDDIYYINDYDDEGIGKVRVYWKAEGLALTAISSDATLLLKYLSEPEIVNLDFADSGDRQTILNTLRNKWETPRPTIEFETKFLINEVDILDKITLEVRGNLNPPLGSGSFKWDAWTWDDGSIWGEELGGIIISSGTEWVVTMIIKDFENWKMIIRAERVV